MKRLREEGRPAVGGVAAVRRPARSAEGITNPGPAANDPAPRGSVRPSRKHRWTLIAVIFLEFYLFTGFHYDRWHKSLLALERPAARIGQGLVVRCDGLGYYAWLRSALIDGDWSFDNEFDDFNVVGDYVPAAAQRTPNQRRANPWSIGPACVWAAVVGPSHPIIEWLERRGSPWPADGYSLPYQLLVGITSVVVSAFGVMFIYKACRQFAQPAAAAFAASLLVLGSTIIFYSSIEVSMAHGIGTTAVAALIWYWAKSWGTNSYQRWLSLGILVGIGMLIRWQLGTLVALPLGEVLWIGLRGRNVLRLLAFTAGLIVACSPQLIAWKVVYGWWLASPIVLSYNWAKPALWQILFCQDRSLFYWTPIVFLAAIASAAVMLTQCCSSRRPDERYPPALIRQPELAPIPLDLSAKITVLFAAFALQVYVLASLWGGGVYLGVAYGFRHLTESIVLLAPGFAVLIERLPGRLRPWIIGFCCLCALWNLLLIAEYRYGMLPADTGADPFTLIASGMRIIQRKRLWLLGQVVIGPLLAWFFVGQLLGRRHPGIREAEVLSY